MTKFLEIENAIGEQGVSLDAVKVCGLTVNFVGGASELQRWAS